jgi:DMSO/TMAO reductase YedYZ molybdopterin-dependent catalytic subunit
MFGRRRFLRTLGVTGAGALAAGALRGVPAWAKAAATTGPDLIERNVWPEHWETTLEALGSAYYTSNERFFVRSHFPVPDVDVSSWRLEVTGLVERPLSLSLAELKKLPQTDAVHVLECAGNGRGLFQLANTAGTQWEHGAVGNARWAGPLLSTLLYQADLKPEAKHVWFEAADRAPLPDVPAFVRSIPIEKALGDTLVALRMNGSPLPRRHGAPARILVPGWFGMASTKWVTRIRAEATPSDNHWFARGYHYVYPGEDPASAPPVQEVKVKSIVTWPLEGSRLPGGAIHFAGFAWGGPAGIRLVEISLDEGQSWRPVFLAPETSPTAWRDWSVDLPVPSHQRLSVMVRAIDGNGQQQPLQARANASGYGNNSIHKVSFRVD